MKKLLVLLAAFLVATMISGCKRVKPGDIATCKEAARKYTGCIGEILGKEMAALSRSKEKAGVPACAKDGKTLAMYRKCLPLKGCKKFMDCLTEYAKRHGP